MSATYYMDGERRKLGVFDIKKGSQYCFFCFENKALYTPFLYVSKRKYNCVNFITYIADDLGLSYNNITTLEIAKDSTRNYVSAVQRYIRDFEKYEMFVNGNIVRDENRIIPHFKKMYSSSRKKMSRIPTLYFNQSDGPSLKVYDKRREMEDEEQAKLNYLPQWLEFGDSAPIYRAEITVRNRDIREYMAKIGIAGEEVMFALSSAEKMAEMWKYEADRLLYFRDRVSGETIRLADL